MPIIRFTKEKPPITCNEKSNLMQTLLAHGLPVASSCYGKGICARCRIKIISGHENLSPINALEKQTRERLSTTKDPLADNERLSCQTKVFGDVIIDADYW